MCIYIYIYVFSLSLYIYIILCIYDICIYIYIYDNYHCDAWGSPRASATMQDILINTNNNTTWSHLGGDLGVAQQCSGFPGLKECYV